MTGTLTQAPTTELTPDALLDAYRTMRTIRLMSCGFISTPSFATRRAYEDRAAREG